MAEFLDKSLYDEPEYDTPEELVVVTYIIAHKDMSGVVPIYRRSVAAKCRISIKLLNKILERFETINKLIFSQARNHIWWKSGINHSLNRGNFSEKQMKSVVKLLKKWQNSGVFDENFIPTVVQIYVRQYSIAIPIMSPISSDTNTNTNTDTDADCEISGQHTAHIQNPEVNMIYQTLNMSDLNHLLKPEGRRWISNLIAKFGIDRVQAGFDSMLKKQARIVNRVAAWNWIENQREDKQSAKARAEREFIEGKTEEVV